MGNPVIIVLIVVIAVLFAIYMIRSASKGKEEKRIPNYKALFILGVVFLPIGIATENPGLYGMGFIFMIIGGFNKNKWGTETKWGDLSPDAKRIKLIVVGGLTAILLVALAYYIFVK